MTTLREIDWGCPLCGEMSRQMRIGSTNQLRPPDLDLRPGEMKRSTMEHWVRRCPECGFVADPLTTPDAAETQMEEVVRAVVAGREYQRQLFDSLPELANDFLCRALLDEAAGRLASAGWSALRAAWACDDAGRDPDAVRLRERALELWEAAEATGEEILRGDGLAPTQLLLADVNRRARRFERALECCHRALSGRPKDPIRSLLEFELELTRREDVAAHSVGEVLREE